MEVLRSKIAQEAKKMGRHTEKSIALDEAKARVQVCEDQQSSMEEAAQREMARHQKAMEDIFLGLLGNHNELTNAAGSAVQTGLELQYDDPDKELENELDSCCMP